MELTSFKYILLMTNLRQNISAPMDTHVCLILVWVSLIISLFCYAVSENVMIPVWTMPTYRSLYVICSRCPYVGQAVVVCVVSCYLNRNKHVIV